MIASALLAPSAVAQDEAVIAALATVLAVEDARRFDPAVFRAATMHPSTVVRRHAALAMGRVGHPDALSMLIRLTTDPDTSVNRAAVFALGLLGSVEAIPTLRQVALAADDRGSASAEAAVACARIGGQVGADAITDILNRWVGLVSRGDIPAAAVGALRNAWRLGEHAPVELVDQFAESRQPDVRAAAIYSLGRLRSPTVARSLLRALEDSEPLIRATAVRTLDASFADSAGISRTALVSRVERLVVDPDAGVRIHALQSLASFDRLRSVSLIADRAGDEAPNVRVQALLTLGSMNDPDAAEALLEHVSGGIFATRHQALLSLARVSVTDALPIIEEWRVSRQWRDRYTATEALGAMGLAGVPALRHLTTDPDPRVVSGALRHLLDLDVSDGDSIALSFTDHGDVGVRAVVYEFLGSRSDTAYASILLNAYEDALRDHTPQARTSLIGAFGVINRRAGPGFARRFVARFPTNDDYTARLVAERLFPAAAATWGPSRPIETGRAIADYRELARELVLPAERGILRPEVVIETDRGNVGIRLLPADAPRTVQAILELIDRRYYDGGAWHRVVPNFVVQDGDRRGDGSGSPGFTLRDEVSPQRYETGTVGLARAGPDTGGSQFFITVSPQPHLDGSYTVFGHVESGLDIIHRITLGDRIRRIRRR